MEERIKLPRREFNPVVGDSTDRFLKSLTYLDEISKERLITETTEILSQCSDPLDDESSKTGLVVGYVQSGKTLSFTTLISLANDNNYKFVIVLAGVANNLLTQTFNRLKKDLNLTNRISRRYFKIFCNPSKHEYFNEIKEAHLEEDDRTVIITVLKHHQHITELYKIFKAIDFISSNSSCLIIDDEADQYSLNGKGYSNFKNELEEETATYSAILKLRNSLKCHSYIQYTATPQGPMLIAMNDILKPQFCKILTPGEKYTGGLIFFNDKADDLIVTVPNRDLYIKKENELQSRPETLIHAIWDYLVSSYCLIVRDSKLEFTSMLIHPGRENAIISRYYNWTCDYFSKIKESVKINDIEDLEYQFVLNSVKESCVRMKVNVDLVNDVILGIKSILKDIKIYEVIKGRHTQIEWNENALNILVGGEMLNRGYTVENLITTYLTRVSKVKSNSDTLQQRARFFGYKKDYIDYCRVYLSSFTKDEFYSYVRHEESFRSKLKKQTLNEFLNNSLFELSDNLELTRKSILSGYYYNIKLDGWIKFDSWFAGGKAVWEKSIINQLIDLNNPAEMYNYNNDEGVHAIFHLDYTKTFSLIYTMNVVDSKMRVFQKIALLQVMEDYLTKDKDQKFEVILMNFDLFQKNIGRTRKVHVNSNGSKSVDLFVGRNKNYLGDDHVHSKSFPITIQIHSVLPKENNTNDLLFFAAIRVNNKYNFKTVYEDDDN